MLTYNMEHRDNESRYYYIYKMIKKDIQDGTLRKGEKLPSKRALAEHLGVSLITVENAYQMLKEEGYIEPRERSGYFVCEIHAFSRERVEEQKLHMLPQKAEYVRDGRLDDTAAANFPYSVYFKTIRGVITDYGEELMRRSPNEGCAILRNSIASYLLRYRGVFAQPEQIICMERLCVCWGRIKSMGLRILHTHRFARCTKGPEQCVNFLPWERTEYEVKF